MSLLSHYTGLGSPVVAEDVPMIYQMSYMYFFPLGCLVGLLVGSVVSYLTGGQDLSSLRHDLITPCMRGFLPSPTLLPAPEELKLIAPNNNVKIFIGNGV